MAADAPETPFNQVAGRGLDRLQALSDGAFAIVMTLLVIELRAPTAEAVAEAGGGERGLLRAISGQLPLFGTYLLSFMTLGLYWVGQQAQHQALGRLDRHLTWIHLAFLAAAALMPFSTALLAENLELRTAFLWYWANSVLMGGLLGASWLYAGRAGLVADDTPPDVRRAIGRRVGQVQIVYAVGAALVIVGSLWSIGWTVLAQLWLAVAPTFGGLSEKERARSEPEPGLR